MEHLQLSESSPQKETLRVETFSDGVFCIAITLLSIEIGVEIHGEVNNKRLTEALLSQWPVCLAYVISFINVLLAWIGHHSLFKMFVKTNNAVMIANGLLLMLVALVPFPTKTLGIYFLTGGFQTAVIFYTAYFVLISVAFRGLWYAATSRANILSGDITRQQIRQTTRNENIGLLCNSLILAVAFINPWAALILSFVMWIYWIVFA